jgi:hypothetical protein
MKPRHKFKMRTCEVCGREYKAFPVRTRKGGVSYKGLCPHCGSFDWSRDGRRGHLDVSYDQDAIEDAVEYIKRTRRWT